VDAITVCPPKEREVAGSNPAQSTHYHARVALATF
jgi:hypothetical protein